MKKKIFSFIIGVCLLFSNTIVGQNNIYPIIKVNGIEYYQYSVQVSEGVFGISRKFEISQAELIKLNPEIEKGLNAGQKILIPIHKKNIEKIVQKSSNEKKSSQEFIQHKVEKKQTLFAISRKYNVTEEEITKFNPQIIKGLSEGAILQIPIPTKNNQQEVEDKPEIKITEKQIKTTESNKKSFISHLVQQNETLYSISKHYNVDMQEIIKLNPGAEISITLGSELKIPASKDGVKPISEKIEKTSDNSKSEIDLNSIFYKNNLTHTKRVINIAFLLPLMLDQDKNDPSIERFIEFYAGSLLAVQKAKDKGISFEIYTYDTEKSEQKITEVLGNSEIKTMDLIIGPAFSSQVSLVAEFAKENKINTLVPFTSKVPEIEYNSFLFQFNPGSDAELKFMFNTIKEKYNSANIIFAEVPGVNSLDEGKIWAEELQSLLKRNGKQFKNIELTSADYADFSKVLKKDEKNLVIFNTDKFAYISQFINPLYSKITEYDIVLFKQYSWKKQNERMPQSIYISPFISKYNPTEIVEFNNLYEQLFNKEVSSESPRYDLLGYDLSNYFISILQKNGNKLINKISSTNISNGIQSQLLFERTSDISGFVNKRLYLVEDKAE
ncbi:MAG: LysM peptidoglycan-binding domain-containing protein [Paludibacter sp.]